MTTVRKIKPRPDFTFEDQYMGQIVCGVDEVGRGPLAGPVVAAAVIIDRTRMPVDILAEINDSKKLSEKKRTYLYSKIMDICHVSIAQCEPDEIDDINILQASLRAMQKACIGLNHNIDVALIDGNKAPKLPFKTHTIVKGDSKSLSIAAASIIAKHTRDEMMKKFAIEFPEYGWESNAGYGTVKHLKAIEIYGVTRHHRTSFSPVANKLLEQKTSNN